MRTYATLPPVPSGYPLESGRSWFSVVIPLARTNENLNPSFETNTTFYNVGSGTLARTTDEQYHGAYSAVYTPAAATTDGFYTTSSTTSGETRVYSCKFKGVAGKPYAIALNNTLVDLAAYRFRATGRWQWVWFFYKAVSSAAPRFYFRKDGDANTSPFYVDGVQVEHIDDGILAPTTYIDGDQQGLVTNQYPPAYIWSGTPHASTSSRSGQTRSGGYVMPLSRYGFLLLAVVGLGMITPVHAALPYAQLDGAQYERTQFAPRTFSLPGRIQARSAPQLDRYRADLAAALGRDRTGQQQPLTLLYQRYDGERAQSDAARLLALYSGGLDGNMDSLFAETVALTFTMYLPAVLADREQGAALTVQESVSDANRVLIRSALGDWSAVSTGAASGSVVAIARGQDGTYYFGGSFSSFGGVANTKYIAMYNPTTGAVSAMGSGAGAGGTAVNDIQIAPNGDVYVIGDFANMGGVAAADYVARWDGSWNAVGTPSAIGGFASQRLQSAFDLSGNFYVPSGTANIYQWDGSAWATVGTAAGGGAVVISVARAPNGDILALGSFTSVDAVSATNIARYNPTTDAWSAMGAGIGTGRVAVSAVDGRIYASDNTPDISVYNGVDWQSIATISAAVYDMSAGPDGRLYFGGQFTTIDGVSYPGGIAVYNGSIFVPPDVAPPGSETVSAIEAFPDGALAIGYNTAGTAIAAAVTTVTNEGTAKSYPTLTLTGPTSGTSRVYQIVNYTTNRAVYLNYTINAGETARLVFDPANLSFTSDFQGNLASTILPGSTEADFFLQPGENVISFFAAESTVTATLTWRPAFEHLAELTT